METKDEIVTFIRNLRNELKADIDPKRGSYSEEYREEVLSQIDILDAVLGQVNPEPERPDVEHLLELCSTTTVRFSMDLAANHIKALCGWILYKEKCAATPIQLDMVRWADLSSAVRALVGFLNDQGVNIEIINDPNDRRK